MSGGKRDRTDDLLLAKQALSQLSYAPVTTEVIGPGRFELPTSSLSGTRSNQLSYEPSSVRSIVVPVTFVKSGILSGRF